MSKATITDIEVRWGDLDAFNHVNNTVGGFNVGRNDLGIINEDILRQLVGDRVPVEVREGDVDGLSLDSGCLKMGVKGRGEDLGAQNVVSQDFRQNVSVGKKVIKSAIGEGIKGIVGGGKDGCCLRTQTSG